MFFPRSGMEVSLTWATYSISNVRVVNSTFCCGFEVLTAVVMICSIFWDITSCGLLKVNRR
jgi:hypothetical protein